MIMHRHVGMRQVLGLALLFLAACGSSQPPAENSPPPGGGGGTPPPVSSSGFRAGAAVVDMTPAVGYCAGQYCDTTSLFEGLQGGDIDPYLHATLKQTSTGVQSRLTARAVVIEGPDGTRIALVKTDNYLAQDLLLRRVGQLLRGGDSGIGYEQILHTASHAHSTAYSSSLAVGLFIFQDVFDARFFEHQARRIAEAIETAAGSLRPAAMGATVVPHSIFKGNVVGLATADDGTPAGYPREFGDLDLTVLRFDDISDPTQPTPLAIWVNFGQHPESLDGYDMHSADFLAPLERFVDRETGAALIFSQGDVGSAEGSGGRCEILDDDGKVILDTTESVGGSGHGNCGERPVDLGVMREWFHEGYAQAERGARYLADEIIAAWQAIGEGNALIPMAADHVVDYRLAWVPGPISHPYPSISNCRTEPTLEGNIGLPIVGFPDCGRFDQIDFIAPALVPLAAVVENLRGHGLNVVPDHYDFTGFAAVEENLRIMLQTFRIGEVLLASCACEAQVDLILNLKSRLDRDPEHVYNGFDWGCLIEEFRDDPAYAAQCAVQQRYFDAEATPTPIPGVRPFDPERIARMRAQVHNDAAGWDAPAYAPFANSEPAEISEIKGNFTRETIQDLGQPGYLLPVGIGHGGDYHGYTVSYREYMNRDHYRKALTSYGPHTADYAVTRLVRMAAAMQGGQELTPELLQVVGSVDELRQVALSEAVGIISGGGHLAFENLLANNQGPAEALVQPTDIERFSAATFTWRGGSNAIDNPVAVVEREIAPGQWEVFGDMSGEVQTRVQFPQGVRGLLDGLTGIHEWRWTANFEAFTAFPRRLGSTPPGRYRFRVNGQIRESFATQPYEIVSEAFEVRPWSGIAVEDVSLGAGSLGFRVPPIRFPASYESDFGFIDDGEAERHICKRCSFRPWARTAEPSEVWVEVVRANGQNQHFDTSVSGERHTVALSLAAGDIARIHVRDDSGNHNTPVALQTGD
jgi:hypothetical protein